MGFNYPNTLPIRVTFLRMKKREFEGEVTIIHEDMRTWNAPERADIIVSELLGSFGDNELSPECLEAARKLVHGR